MIFAKAPPGSRQEITALIEVLHASEQRLAQLTSGEIDAVADREGRTLLLRRAQDHMRTSEAQRRSDILDALPAHIALLDSRGVIVSVNRAWTDFAHANGMMGTGHGVGVDYIELCRGARGDDAGEARRAAQGLSAVLAGDSSRFSIEYPCHSPHRKRWFLLTATPIGGDPPQGAVVMHVEVTSERSAQESLLASELRFRQLAENIREVFWLTDPAKQEILYVSPAYEEIWGRTCESVYASPGEWMEAVHVDDRARITLASRKQAAGTYAEEYRIVRPDGRVRWIRDRAFPVYGEDGLVYRIAGLAEDITMQIRARDELLESERRLSDMLGNVELISIMLDLQGRLTYCNDYLLRLTEWEREEILGRNWFDIFVPPENIEIRADFAKVLVGSARASHYENEILSRSGARMIIQWNNTLLKSPDGDVVGLASIGQDVTVRTRAEAEVRRFNIDLERRVVERTVELHAANAELEAFDYSVAHDLRAPLTRIEGFGAMLDEQYGAQLDEQGRGLLRRIRDSARGLDTLVADLFELSTVAKGELKRGTVDITALAESIVASLRNSQPERDVAFAAAPNLGVRADPGLTAALLENLLGNAWKFTGKRDHATIEIGSVEVEGEHVLFVRDNGAGFDSANAGRLFTPFQRLHTSSEFEGTGIGLATVQRIVRRHGGRAWAQSAVGRGATFFFTLSS